MKTWFILCGLAGLIYTGSSLRAQTPPVGQSRARLTPEVVKKFDKNGDGELDAVERAAARSELGRAARPSEPPGVAPAATTKSGPSLGLKPLSEMTASDRYNQEDGGLYGGGVNEPPPQHLAIALREAAQVVPRNAQGLPSPDGKIVLVSLGMSNTTAEFSRFMQLAGETKGPHIVLVDGAQLGRTASEWANPEQSRRPRAGSPWTVLESRLKEAGVAPQQVQVVWIKQAEAFPANLGEFPKHADTLRDNLVIVVNQLKQRYPNVRVAYLSSRTYGGYAQSGICPEPFAYEGAFAVRRLIQDQIRGNDDLNYDPRTGAVVAPVLLWGPYLWADGDSPRQADGLTWMRGDFREDGTHPSTSGANKAGGLLLKFMQADPTARTWFGN